MRAQLMKLIFAPLTFLLIPCISVGQVNDEYRQTPATHSRTPLPTADTIRSEAEIETDKAAIESVWNGFQAALLANDIQLAGQYFAPYSRERYVKLLEQMGSQMSKMPDGWSEFTPIRIGSELAVYGFIQKETNGDRLHSVTFVLYPGYGWLIQSY